MRSSKGIAMKLLFWLMLCIIVALVFLIVMGKIGTIVGNSNIFDKPLVYVHIPSESDMTLSVSPATEYIIKGVEESPFTVYADIAMKKDANFPKEGTDVIISFQGYMQEEDFSGCRVEKTIKPGDDIRVYSDECPSPPRLKAFWSGPVNLKVVVIDAKSGNFIASKDTVLTSFIRLSSFGSGGSAVCRAANEYRSYSNSALYLINDLGDLTLTVNEVADENVGKTQRLVINGEICSQPEIWVENLVQATETHPLTLIPGIIDSYVVRQNDKMRFYSGDRSVIFDMTSS